MRLGIAINLLRTEKPHLTTTELAMAAMRRGHDVCYLPVADMSMLPDGSVVGVAHRPPPGNYRSPKHFIDELKGTRGTTDNVNFAELDILLLRNNPNDDKIIRPWALDLGIQFGLQAAQAGVVVVNDPTGLSRAYSKMYLLEFPERVRPLTMVTRNPDEVESFVSQVGAAVLKPVQGSGGHGVFIAKAGDRDNMQQIIESILDDGYVMAQQYLPKAVKGDVRLMLLNGEILKHKGKIAAYRRIGNGEDMRNNICAGGAAVAQKLTDEMLEVTELIRSKLIRDGMFFVGLDMVGDKIIEINVFSPGGLTHCRRLKKMDFTGPVIDALEDKLVCKDLYRGVFANREIATL